MSSNWGTVLSAYVFTGVGVGAYAAWIIGRGRSVGRELGIGRGNNEEQP